MQMPWKSSVVFAAVFHGGIAYCGQSKGLPAQTHGHELDVSCNELMFFS